jgi:hypothetical protein
MEVRYRCEPCKKTYKAAAEVPGGRCKDCDGLLTLLPTAKPSVAPTATPVVTAAPVVAPVGPAPAPPAPRRPHWGLVAFVAGTLLVAAFGTAVAVAVSTKKADLTLLGLVGYALLWVALSVAAFVAVVTLRAGRAYGGAGVAGVAGNTLPAARVALVAALAMLAPAVGVALVEAFGPPEGFVVKSANDREAGKKVAAAKAVADKIEADERAAEEARVETDTAQRLASEKAVREAAELAAFERARWQRAEFVLLNPASRAVGLRKTDRGLEVTAVANDKAVTALLSELWKQKTPVVANHPELAKRVGDQYEPGGLLRPEDTEAVVAAVRAWDFVPKEPKLFAYTPLGTKVPRVGHLLAEADGKYVVAGLVPRPARGAKTADPAGTYVAEVVPRDAVKPGSAHAVAPGELTNVAELLQRWHYDIVGKLQQRAEAAPGLPIRPVVFIDDATLPSSEHDRRLAELKAQVRNFQLEKVRAVQESLKDESSSELYGEGYGVFMVGMLAAMEDARKQANRMRSAAVAERGYQEVIDDLRKEYDELVPLIEAGRLVTREVSKRFVDTGFSVVDRSKGAKGAYYKILGDSAWARPDALTAVTDNLVQATHILLTEVGAAEGEGYYRVAMKLVDVRTGEIVWTDHADRIDPATPERLRYTDLTGTWKTAQGDKLEVTSTKKKVALKLAGDHPLLEDFSLVADRNLDSFTVTSSMQIYKGKKAAGRAKAIPKSLQLSSPTARQTFQLTNRDKIKLVVPRYNYNDKTKEYFSTGTQEIELTRVGESELSAAE